jgi:competence CoiA-like predicted nuclease
MKYAIVNGEKSETFKGEVGLCPCCNSELIARCSDIKINHWAHKGTINCDPWWENETEWNDS